MYKKLLLLTVNPVPNPGKGGPGAVVERLARSVNLSKDDLGWEATFLSPSGIKIAFERKRAGRLRAFFMSLLKELVLRPLDKYCVNKVSLIRSRLITFYRVMIYRRKIENYRLLLLHHINKIVEADLIHAHEFESMIAFLKIAKAKKFRKKILLSIHSPGATSLETIRLRYPEQSGTFFERLMRYHEILAIDHATALAFPSEGTFHLLQQDLPEISRVKKQVYVIYNGIEPVSPTEKKGKIRKEISLSDSSIIVLAVGRLVRDKGFDILIRSIKNVMETTKRDIHLVLVGEGPEKAVLDKLVSDLGLKSNVHLLGYREDLADIFTEAYIFVAPSRRSAFDLTMLEALSIGVPVVATSVGGNKEALQDDVGILVEPEDEESLSRAISTIITDTSLRESLCVRSAKRFQTRFTIDTMVRSYISLYDELVS